MRLSTWILLGVAASTAACSSQNEFAGELFADPARVDFGLIDPQRLDREPVVRTVILTNTGSAPLRVEPLALSGDAAAWISIEASPPGVLEPGDLWPVTLTLDVPDDTPNDSYSATLDVEGAGVSVPVGSRDRGADGAALQVPLIFVSGSLCDKDGDGFIALECGGDDCDDDDPTVYPGAPELCDGKDNNCDGVIDDGANEDGDGDGFSACDGDCNDLEPLIYPGAPERCNYTDDDCDGIIDEGFREGNKYTRIEHCGFCDNDCTELDFQNATAFCDTDPTVPACDFDCDPGFFDANDDPTDGCECEYLSPVDEPFDGIDADCDGTDGDPSLVVFVSSTTGRPDGAGTIDDPLDLVSRGVDLAVATGRQFVAVAGGTYREDVEIADGVTVFGGWNTTFDERDPEVFVATIVGSGDGPAVTAQRIATRTTFDGMGVRGTTQVRAGAPSIAMWIEDATENLIVTNNVIEAAVGRNGAAGFNGTAGSDGSDGDVGVEGGLTTCDSLPSGGDGAAGTCGDTDVSGGDGGGAVCPVARADQPSGFAGASELGGVGGEGACDASLQFDPRLTCVCRISGCWDDGLRGARGDNGDDGLGGAGGLEPAGFFESGGGWVASAGLDGADGSFGGGGGGGGAGSGAENVSCEGRDHQGGTGGGGGSGGCGGLPGAGGGGGGGSFGLVLFYEDQTEDLPVFTNNIIEAGNGGVGGAGGAGGVGGDGGFGGLGGRNNTTAWCSQKGGDGGDGGRGGNGGGGGGGAGGSSYAAYAIGLLPSEGYLVIDNELFFGEPGAGGAGGAGGRDAISDGQPGVPGEAAAVNW